MKYGKKVNLSMTEKYARVRVMGAVSVYLNTLKKLSLSKMVKEHPKVAVSHMVTVIKPIELKTFVESQLTLKKNQLKKEFLNYTTGLQSAWQWHSCTIAQPLY